MATSISLTWWNFAINGPCHTWQMHWTFERKMLWISMSLLKMVTMTTTSATTKQIKFFGYCSIRQAKFKSLFTFIISTWIIVYIDRILVIVFWDLVTCNIRAIKPDLCRSIQQLHRALEAITHHTTRKTVICQISNKVDNSHTLAE